MSSTITGITQGVTLIAGGQFANPLTIQGTIEAGAGDGVQSNTSWSIDNQGLITAAMGDGLLLDGGLSGADTVMNTGIVSGGSYGVRLANLGGDFTNAAAGQMTGALGGVYFSGQLSSYSVFDNFGTIIGGSGPGLRGSAIMVSNALGGTIDGGSFGIEFGSGATLTNEGLIKGAVGVQASFYPVIGGGVNVTDAGTIIGTNGVAVSFGTGDSGDMTLLPGASFSGAIEGASATLVFGGSSLTNFTQFGSVSGFAAVSVAAGAEWAFAGDNTLNMGLGVENAGLIAETQGQQLLIEHGLSGAGSLVIGGGALVLVRGAAAASQSIDFAGDGTLALFAPQSFAATIANFASGDTIELIGLASNAVVTGSMVGSVLDLAGSVPNGTTIAFDNPPSGIVLQPVAGLTKSYDIVVPPLPCFAEGTHLLTPSGMRPVEDLRKGDQVITRAGMLSVIWHGRRRVDCARHPTPTKVWPVRIERDAFGPGLPVRPLFLSPDHALYSDGALIPVQFLINGITIRQEPVASVTYHHIELERHEIIWAENLPTESYLDCGNRHQFGGKAAQTLHADFAPPVWATARACAPLALRGPAVAAARRRAHATLVAQGYRAEPGRLMMFAEGEVVPVNALPGRWYRVAIPRGARALTLRSIAAAPCCTDPWSEDRRVLGLAIEAVTLDGRQIDANDPCFGEGFYPPEQGARGWFRWTDGAGSLTTEGACTLRFRLRTTMLKWRAPQAEQVVRAEQIARAATQPPRAGLRAARPVSRNAALA